MKLEIKNLKVAQFASEETLCFEATLYVNGVRAIIAKNDGHGGPNDYDVVSHKPADVKKYHWAMEVINGHVANLPEVEAFGSKFPASIDLVIDEAIQQEETLQFIRKKLKRCIHAVRPDGKVIYFSKAKPTAENIQKISVQRPDVKVLNTISDEVELLAAFKTAGVVQ